MLESVAYSHRDSEYQDFTEEEWNMFNSYSYDDYQGFSDLKLFNMQNNTRNYKIWDDFDIHYTSISWFILHRFQY